jgi:MFS family permease
MSRDADVALILGGVLYGVGNGLMWPSYLMMLSDAGPHESQGAIQGLGSSVGSLASIAGTLVGGVLYVAAGVVAFYVAASVIALATGIFIAHAQPRVARLAATSGRP